MLKGVDIKETVEYVSPSDAGDNPTKFILGNISNRDKLTLFADAINEKGEVDMKKVMSKAVDVVQAGLKGIKNLGGKDYDVITEEIVDMLSFIIMSELVGKILELNFVSEGQAKN